MKAMKKFLRIIGKILLVLLIALILFLIVMFIYNKVKIKQESIIFENPIGRYVEIDGHKMCVYTEGEGTHTFVFLSGSGTSSPILDFKSIYSRLSDDYRIVVIEKFGYGFSDISGTERDFDTILRQDREALSKLGIEAPFILCPHSMSGLEAIMWSQQYPEEVEAVIGLDMATPEAYEGREISEGTEKVAYAINAAARDFGILRLLGDEQLMTSTVLSPEEKEMYRKILYARLLNDDVISEGDYTDEACDKIRSQDMPGIPMLLFVSDGSGGTGIDKDSWRGIAKEFASKCQAAQIVELDCPHYVHNYETDCIEEEMRSFVETLDD